VQTLGGKIYFGDHPPEGSTVVTTLDKPICTVERRPATPQERAPLAKPKTEWRTNIACQDLRLTGFKEASYDGVNRRVQGMLTHVGRHVVKDVWVCGGGVCDVVKSGAPMAKGESAMFYLDTHTTGEIPLSIECSVREPSS
jgi:hypothetical protein